MSLYYLSPNSVANNISHDRSYNANYDIVWSFEYAMSGVPDESQGSFTTFLYDGEVVSLTGGAPGKGGAYTPLSADSQFYNGLSEAVIGINFDTNGLFAVSGSGVDGVSAAKSNTLSIRGGTTGYDLLTSVELSSLSVNIPLTLSAIDYNRLRFRLADIGSTLKISYSDGNANYIDLFSYPINLPVITTTSYKVGVGFSGPVSGVDAIASKFSIRNYHVEGVYDEPTTEILDLSGTTLESYPVSGVTGTSAPSANIVSRLAKITLYDCPEDPVIPPDDPDPCTVT